MPVYAYRGLNDAGKEQNQAPRRRLSESAAAAAQSAKAFASSIITRRRRSRISEPQARGVKPRSTSKRYFGRITVF